MILSVIASATRPLSHLILSQIEYRASRQAFGLSDRSSDPVAFSTPTFLFQTSLVPPLTHPTHSSFGSTHTHPPLDP